MKGESGEILLVEDDESMGFLIKDSLIACGYHVQLYQDGETGLTAFHNHNFDLCILDVMLPKKDGFDLAQSIRKYNQEVPIIFLTAKNQTADRIRGFQSGADDYVCKPFSIEEFKYRVSAILKRSGKSHSETKNVLTLHAGQSTLDAKNLLLIANGVSTQLTYKECKVLQLFFRHPNQLIERDLFLKSIWQDEGFFVARSMDVFISRLRKYLKPDASVSIKNVRGIGYVIKVSED